jgi:hypothetical protein
VAVGQFINRSDQTHMICDESLMIESPKQDSGELNKFILFTWSVLLLYQYWLIMTITLYTLSHLSAKIDGG